MYCSACGAATNQGGVKFCSNCGGSLTQSSRSSEELLEVRYMAVANIQKQILPSKKFFVINSQKESWPENITYDIAAVFTGVKKDAQYLSKHSSSLVTYDFVDSYDNHQRQVALNEIMRSGRHLYYPVDFSIVQGFVVEHLNQLSHDGWRLVGSLPTVKSTNAKLTVGFYGPLVTQPFELSIGMCKVMYGEDESHPDGVTILLKR